MAKDIYATKTGRSKLYQYLNFLNSFIEYDGHEYMLLKNNNIFVPNKTFFITADLSSLDLNGDNYMLIKTSEELKTKIETLSNKDELSNYFNIKEEANETSWLLEGILKGNSDLTFKIEDNEKPMCSFTFKSKLITKLYDSAKEDSLGYHKYACIKMNNTNVLKLTYLKDSYELSRDDYVIFEGNESFNTEYFDFYMPYEVFKSINKVEHLSASLYHRPEFRGNILSLELNMFNHNINFRYLVMGDQNFLVKRNDK